MSRPLLHLNHGHLSATLSGLVLLGVLSPATAQTAVPDWSACAKIDADTERLACFDRLASSGPVAIENDTTKNDTAKPGAWEPSPSSTQETPVADSGMEDNETIPLINESEPVALERRLQSEQSGERNPFVMRSYKPNYIMPATYTPTDLSRDVYDFEPQHAETKFQLSFQFDWFEDPFGPNTALYFGYTQLSLWQTYNTKLLGEEQDASSPFRETNYEPEVGLTIDTDFSLAGLTFKRNRLSLIHTSNGQGGERSRSWNRLAASTSFGRGNFAGRLRAWYRLPEADEDENPDITDYMGYGDLLLAYKWNEQTIAATLRNNLDFANNKGAIQVDYSFPLSKRVKGYVQYFNGYGESLIDYNRSVSRIGVGIALTDWL
ncbi:phospholipase A [Guyparkeria hydrothermalis]|uniref:phospholipase A n=1 Tax=Guyparkeria TaxID=2035712 RepID=UPI00145C4995|nr:MULTISPECIES: phospholipase A [Guyparkeria]MCL7751910.1 phospholipase A [Guyparkeria hydrothermalis]